MAPHPNYISLCTGIGGLDLGLRAALPDARCVCVVENEVTAAAVLAARMAEGRLDDCPVWTDLRSFDGVPWRGLVQGVIGGIPCQPFSTAGKRAGESDRRNLWPDTLRIVGDIAPSWCFFENVPGMANKSVDWYYYRAVRPRLQEMGYRVAEGFFTAEEVGAPHRRERLFILADAGYSTGSPELRQQSETQPAGAGERGEAVGDAGGGRRRAQSYGNKPSAGVDRTGNTLAARPYEWPPGPQDTEAWASVLRERPDLAPATPLAQPGVRPVADGLPGVLAGLKRDDLPRMLGNAVVPATATLAFRTLLGHIGHS